MAYTEDGSATFVGLERVSGTVDGRQGTIVVRHIGSYQDGVASAELSILQGCGTGELVDLAGDGDFRADPSGAVRLRLV